MKFLVIFFSCLVLSFLISPVSAEETMESSQYRLKPEGVRFNTQNIDSRSYNLSVTAGEVAAREFAEKGYFVKAILPSNTTDAPFALTLSDISVDLGTMVPQSPSIARVDLTVASTGTYGYTVSAEELGVLRTKSGTQTIPNTSCNGGSSACTSAFAHVWSSLTAYGFGYNVTGQNAPVDFKDETYYRSFPDSEAQEQPSVVLSGINSKITQKATLTFKALASPAQAAGTYHTIIRLTAVPQF